MEKNCIVTDVLVFNSKNEILLVKHKKLGTWIYPGGHVEENEVPDKAALRETLEETGLNVRLIDAVTNKPLYSDSGAKRLAQPLMIMLEDVPYSTGHHNHFDLLYIAEPINGNESAKISDESENIGWFGEGEIDKLGIKFKSVAYVIHEAFKTYKKIKRGQKSI